ncbi:MAG: CopD family protein [Candidatus Methylomirabilis oxyfera]|nr:CopD family protein [Candidatus Methylomirabilis oxyfera]
MLGFQLAITFHLAGIIFWLGGLGARLILLNSANAGANEGGRSQLYQLQQKIHLMMEAPAFVVALMAGLFLVHATKVTFNQPWFRAKIALVLGLIAVSLIASRQFKAFNASGRVGQAMGLFAGLVVFTLLTLVAVLTKF